MPIMQTVIQGGGTTPTGTKSITANGVYDVTNYASADVQVPTTAPEIYRVFRVNNGKIENSITTPFLPLPSTATDIGNYCYVDAYKNTPASVLSGAIDLSSLTTLTGESCCYNMFSGCTGITSVDLSNLKTIITSGGPKGILQSAFYGCTGLTAINLDKLEYVSAGNSSNSAFNSTFGQCTSLTTVSLNKLNTITFSLCASTNQTFRGCTHLESIEFGGLTSSTFASKLDQIKFLFHTDTGSQAPNGCTVHFPSNFDPSDPNHTFDASTLGGYPTFGGSASYIHLAFDLPATE